MRGRVIIAGGKNSLIPTDTRAKWLAIISMYIAFS